MNSNQRRNRRRDINDISASQKKKNIQYYTGLNPDYKIIDYMPISKSRLKELNRLERELLFFGIIGHGIVIISYLYRVVVKLLKKAISLFMS